MRLHLKNMLTQMSSGCKGKLEQCPEQVPPHKLEWYSRECHSSGNEGAVLHISEAYEHDPILPYQAEEGASCPLTGCVKTGSQCVDVTAEIVLTPTAVMGTPVVTCQGNPAVTCAAAADGRTCTVTLTQRVCVSIPVRFGVTKEDGDPTIACAGGDAASETCCCRTT